MMAIFWISLVAILGLILYVALHSDAPDEPEGWISWYRGPRPHDEVMYLVRYGDGEGFYYSRKRVLAEVFPTREAALAVTPVYDGSADIEGRAGVEEA